MKLIKFFFSFLVIVSVFSCSSSTDSTTEKILVDQKPILTYTSSSNLKITIPSGWREIADNHNQLFDIWLVNELNNAVISFIPINIDNSFENIPIDEKLEIIKQIVINKKKSSAEDFEILEEKSELAKYNLKLIKFMNGKNIQNSILFGTENNYYECLAYFKYDFIPNSKEIELLFKTQEIIVKESSII